ncbi:MAG TPA: LemA family protein [Pirellulales bacterium]|nr:LemA family protein [Pirellulales bacterium]
MKVLGGILLGLLVLALLGGGCVYQGYNSAIGLDEEVKQRWAQVENELQRRYELIPNLVNTVKGIAGQEQKVFLGVANARKAYFQAQDQGTVAEKAEAAGDVERTLSRLLMLQEKYPELKSNESFLKLQDELEGTENRLAVERKRYNDAVQTLNIYVRRFPGTFFASLAGVHSAEYFKIEAEAKTAPKVDFSDQETKS